jgi:hypothetical protein
MTLVDLIAKYLPEDIKVKVAAGQPPQIGANSPPTSATPPSELSLSAEVARPAVQVEAQPAVALAASQQDLLPAGMDPDQEPAEFEERAAILEFDAGFSRREAERMAKRGGIP